MDAEEWLEPARVRLREAIILHEHGENPGALFMAHQAIEMALKAVLVTRTGRLPPRIHGLPELAERVGFIERRADLKRLDPSYVRIRYPGESDEPSLASDDAVQLATEVLAWCESHLT